jgi:uncharacterized protein (TIGR02594 family)
MDPFQLAAKQLGMNERDQNAALSEYMANGGVNLDPAVTAWCAAYVNATLAQAGMQGTGSNLARSFETWGTEVTEPQKGDLAVFWRESPDSGKGHVGFFDGYNPDGTIRVLGGNQSDGVSIAAYDPNQLLGFRRGEGMGGASQMAGVNPQAPGAAPGPEQPNALAPQPFVPQTAMLDVRDFMTSRPNALAAVQPIVGQRTNFLSGRV